MDIVLFFVPQWNPAAPYLSVPLLAGQLSCNNYSVESVDLNAEFYNDCLTKKYLLNSIDICSKYIEQNRAKYHNMELTDKCSLDEKLDYLKYKEISSYMATYQNRMAKVINFISEAINIMRSDDYYDIRLHYKAKIVIEYALDIVSLPYSPMKVDSGRLYNPLFNLSYDDVIYQVNKPSINIFYDYFKEKLKNKYTGCNLFGISIAAESQIVPALTLAKILKERKNIKIILGGSLITRIVDSIVEQRELFSDYCDYVIYGDGEQTIVDLVKALKEGSSLSNIPGLIYKNENNEIIKNSSQKLINVDDIKIPCLKGFDLSKYFAPDIVMLLQMSKGCYWAKCAFCSFSYKKSYCHRKIGEIVKEIKYYRDNYNIRYFRFTDDAISPIFFEELADAFILNNLDIKYVAFARLEEDFTFELLKKIRKSGCILIQWGLETASKRLLALMNKGTENTDKALILKNSDRAGIANYVFLMYGLPSETFQEAMETFYFVKENWDYLMGYTISRFYLEKKSILIDNYKEYGIDNIINNETFLAHVKSTGSKLTDEELDKIKKIYRDTFIKCENGQIKFSLILLTDYTFLYILRYGKEYVKKFRI